ncbi:MAG: lipopolysaccharide kinase InaA family protein [Pseudomonadota bacterium]
MANLNSIQSPSVTAFDLQLGDGSTLAVSEIVRVVPNKRLVCKAVWRGENVYAKLFIGANAERYAQRDQQGVQALMSANITTPDLLFVGNFAANEVLIFEAIDGAQNAEVLYRQLYGSQQSEKRLDLMLELTAVVAQLHVANLQQTDLYFKNFLIDAGKTYAIDGDGIQVFSSLLNKQQKQRNLATLFSKMDVLDSQWIAQCYAHYCKQMMTEYLATDLVKINNLAKKIRQKVASAYADKKVFRTCSDINVRQTFKRYMASANDFNAVDLSGNQLDLALNNPLNRLKSGNTCTVSKAFVSNKNVVIKRYNVKNIWHGFKLSISQSRAAKSWANAHRLNILNIATAKPLALIEERFGWLRRRAYFLTEYIEAPDIAEFFALTIDSSTKEKVACETALLFYKLNILQILHGDCKASNIKIVDGKPVLIDLDSMQSHNCNWWFEKKHIKDLKRFMQNWSHNPEVSALFQREFLQIYDENGINQLSTVLERAKIA